MNKILFVFILMMTYSQSLFAEKQRLRIHDFDEPEVETFLEIGNRNFLINRVGRGKLGSKIVSGQNVDGDTMTIAQSDNGEFTGNVQIQGKNYRVKPNGELERRAGRFFCHGAKRALHQRFFVYQL